MFVKFTSSDRVLTAINAAQVTFISSVTEGTRIRFGEGRSVTVVEPMDEVIERLNRTCQIESE
jgi:tRNA A58 N-methylase Trm61